MASTACRVDPSAAASSMRRLARDERLAQRRRSGGEELVHQLATQHGHGIGHGHARTAHDGNRAAGRAQHFLGQAIVGAIECGGVAGQQASDRSAVSAADVLPCRRARARRSCRRAPRRRPADAARHGRRRSSTSFPRDSDSTHRLAKLERIGTVGAAPIAVGHMRREAGRHAGDDDPPGGRFDRRVGQSAKAAEPCHEIHVPPPRSEIGVALIRQNLGDDREPVRAGVSAGNRPTARSGKASSSRSA